MSRANRIKSAPVSPCTLIMCSLIWQEQIFLYLLGYASYINTTRIFHTVQSLAKPASPLVPEVLPCFSTRGSEPQVTNLIKNWLLTHVTVTIGSTSNSIVPSVISQWQPSKFRAETLECSSIYGHPYQVKPLRSLPHPPRKGLLQRYLRIQILVQSYILT